MHSRPQRPRSLFADQKDRGLWGRKCKTIRLQAQHQNSPSYKFRTLWRPGYSFPYILTLCLKFCDKFKVNPVVEGANGGLQLTDIWPKN